MGAALLPPILAYHKVDARLELGITQVEPAVFRRQIEALARHGYRTLGSRDLAAALAAGAGAVVDLRAVVISFDDGYAALARHAFPVLADHGFGALVFVVTDFVGQENTWDVQYGWRRFAHLDWDDLGHWQERGVEVHSHGATHARLPWLSDGEIADELGRSRETIGARLGRVPTGLSYPFNAVDARVRRHAAGAGYALGFGGPAVRGADPLCLPRRPVYGWDRFALPLALGASRLSGAGLAMARIASRCAVGTAMIQRLLGRRYTGRVPRAGG
jgi:peptidoglycan/xylan/chitin deacetylase (PgdA/CDA1 family)